MWLPFPDRTATNPAAFNLRMTSAQVTRTMLNLTLGYVNTVAGTGELSRPQLDSQTVEIRPRADAASKADR